jgi:hypothetical protein
MIKIFKSKFFLLTVIIFFIAFYVSNINQNKGVIVKKKVKQTQNQITNNQSSTYFSNVTYNFYDENYRLYTLKGEEAIIQIDKPNLINLNKVKAKTSLNKNSNLEIFADKAKFDKNLKDIFFHKNILITNNETIILADNANYLFKKNIIEIFNNVVLTKGKDTIKCDWLKYDINSKNIELKMISQKEQIYGERKN